MSTKLTIKKLSADQLELSWNTKMGNRYALEKSEDLVSWVEAGTYEGYGGITYVTVAGSGQRGFYRIVELMPQGSEPETYTVTYLDGSKVEIHWVPFNAPVPSGQYQIRRDGALIGVVTGDSNYFVDANVESGKTYEYTVGYFS